MKYRSRAEIVSKILEAADIAADRRNHNNGRGAGATKTKIMYNAFLSYPQLKEYLALLAEKDLLRFDKDSRTFKTTEKGHRFLTVYNQIHSMMKSNNILDLDESHT